MNYTERLEKLDFPSFTYRRAGDAQALPYLRRSYLVKDIQTSPSCDTEVRHPLELNIPKDDERGIQLNFFYYRTVKAWNEFPKVVADANIINMFKSKLTGPWKELTLKFCEQYSS